MNIHIGDISNSIQKLDRIARKLKLNIQQYPLLRIGDVIQCVEFIKHILFHVDKDLAAEILSRGCNEQSPNKRIVLVLFDILREQSNETFPISSEQFLGKVCEN